MSYVASLKYEIRLTRTPCILAAIISQRQYPNARINENPSEAKKDAALARRKIDSSATHPSNMRRTKQLRSHDVSSTIIFRLRETSFGQRVAQISQLLRRAADQYVRHFVRSTAPPSLSPVSTAFECSWSFFVCDVKTTFFKIY